MEARKQKTQKLSGESVSLGPDLRVFKVEHERKSPSPPAGPIDRITLKVPQLNGTQSKKLPTHYNENEIQIRYARPHRREKGIRTSGRMGGDS